MTGCLAQASPDVLAKASEVDAVIGLGRLDDLERAVASGAGERVMVTNLRKEKAPIEMAAVTLDGHTRAFLKLQEGCDQSVLSVSCRFRAALRAASIRAA